MKIPSFFARKSGYGAWSAFRNCTIPFILSLSPVWAEPVTIVALGDSLTAGYGLPPEQGFVPQLQAWLDAQGAEAVVLNAGVSGDTTAGGASRLDWALTPETDALIVNLGGNDMLRGIDPTEARANLETILQGAKSRELPVLLVGLQAPANYGADYKLAFNGMFAELAAEYDTLLFSDFFRAITTKAGDQLDPAFMQADGIHPNAGGVANVVGQIGPQVLALIEEAGG